MEELVKDHIFSRSIGWIVSTGAQLRENVHKIEEFREKFKGVFPPRIAQGWAVCAFFAEMVRTYIYTTVYIYGYYEGFSIVILNCFI